MNPTDLRAELLNEVIQQIDFSKDITPNHIADFALPYAERAAIAEAKLETANKRLEVTQSRLDDFMGVAASNHLELLLEKQKHEKPNASYSTAGKMIEGSHDVLVVWPGWNQKAKGRVVNNGETTVVYMEAEYPGESLQQQLAAAQQRVKELEAEILSAYREGHDDATALAIKTIQQHSNDNP